MLGSNESLGASEVYAGFLEDLSSLMSSCSHLQITLNACNAEGWQLSECVGMYFYS